MHVLCNCSAFLGVLCQALQQWSDGEAGKVIMLFQQLAQLTDQTVHRNAGRNGYWGRGHLGCRRETVGRLRFGRNEHGAFTVCQPLWVDPRDGRDLRRLGRSLRCHFSLCEPALRHAYGLCKVSLRKPGVLARSKHSFSKS